MVRLISNISNSIANGPFSTDVYVLGHAWIRSEYVIPQLVISG